MRRQHSSINRSGAALIICLVLIVFLGTISGIILKTVLADRQIAKQELIRQQTVILLHDCLTRAEMIRQADPNFGGETLDFNTQVTTSGTYRSKSVYNEQENAFEVEVTFLDENGKKRLTQRLNGDKLQ